jgi:hypothetical protein
MMLHPSATGELAGNRIFIFVALVLCFTPVYPLYRRARGQSPSIAVPLLLVIAVSVLTAISVLAGLLLPLDDLWVVVVSNLRDSFIVAACLLLIWNAVRKRNRKTADAMPRKDSTPGSTKTGS